MTWASLPRWPTVSRALCGTDRRDRAGRAGDPPPPPSLHAGPDGLHPGGRPPTPRLTQIAGAMPRPDALPTGLRILRRAARKLSTPRRRRSGTRGSGRASCRVHSRRRCGDRGMTSPATSEHDGRPTGLDASFDVSPSWLARKSRGEPRRFLKAVDDVTSRFRRAPRSPRRRIRVRQVDRRAMRRGPAHADLRRGRAIRGIGYA